MKRYEKSLHEAESYLSSAEHNYQRLLQQETQVWNPVVVDCIMAMIKAVDAAMLKHRGHPNNDHSMTANTLQKLYDDGLISDSFKSNVDAVRKWVVDEKTDIQYRNKTVSQRDAERALKSTKRLLDKMRRELS